MEYSACVRVTLFFSRRRQVSVIGTQILARAYDASAVWPAAVDTWGVPVSNPPVSCHDENNTSAGCCGAPGSAVLALYEYRKEEAQVSFVL